MWLDINGETLVNLDRVQSFQYFDRYLGDHRIGVELYIEMEGEDQISLGITTVEIAKGYIALIATNLRAGTPVLSVTTTHEGAE